MNASHELPEDEDASAETNAGAGRDSYWSGLDALWDEAPSAPSRQTALDRSQIVTAAIAIADADGIEAVSIRRVAASIGAGPMSLYRHVPAKEALISFMLDQVLNEAVSADDLPSGNWRAGLRHIADQSWALMRRHPWYAEASMSRPPMSPHSIAGLELSLSVLDGLGLDMRDRMRYVSAIYATVLSAGLSAAVEDRMKARLSLTEEEVSTSVAPYVSRIIESGDYPRVSELFQGMSAADADEEEHKAAIELILDGIATRIDASQE